MGEKKEGRKDRRKKGRKRFLVLFLAPHCCLVSSLAGAGGTKKSGGSGGRSARALRGEPSGPIQQETRGCPGPSGALSLIIHFWNPFHETNLPYKGDCFIDLGPCTSWTLFALSLHKNLARLI